MKFKDRNIEITSSVNRLQIYEQFKNRLANYNEEKFDDGSKRITIGDGDSRFIVEYISSKPVDSLVARYDTPTNKNRFAVMSLDHLMQNAINFSENFKSAEFIESLEKIENANVSGGKRM